MRTKTRTDISKGLDAVDQQLKLIGQGLGHLGAQQGTLNTAAQANQAHALLLQKSTSQLREIDPAKVYSQLAADRYAVEATFSVLGSGKRLSILNYI
jgi:flagellin-like hook-associated protein FlgL